MNNSLDRLLDGIAAALRRDVIPRLDDEYAAGQALAVIDLINNLKPRLDWAVSPLLARLAAQRSLLAELDASLAVHPDRPQRGMTPYDTPVDGRALQTLCDQVDEHIGATLRWLADRNDAGCDAARAAIKRHVHAELRRDMSLTPRPLFAEIARGVDSDA